MAESSKEINQNEEEKNSALEALIDLLPFELNLPGYMFLGPGTKLAERIERGDVAINELDQAALEHDKAYAAEKGNRRKADRILAERAF